MEKLITIFSFTKLFYEAYQQNLPLGNFPASLQGLLSLDIMHLVQSHEDKAFEKANSWKEEAYRNFERIGKIGIEPSNELDLSIQPSKLWGCSFIRVLRMFNERNFYVASCLSDQKKIEDNENLIKSQIKLEPFKNIPLTLSIDEPVNEITCRIEHPIIIQQKDLDRFINSLAIHTFDSLSKESLTKLLKDKQSISEPIKFSCSANSVITFFREMHDNQVIISSKAISKQFIHRYFLFESKKTKKFESPSLGNITTYLTRSTPPGVLTRITFVE